MVVLSFRSGLRAKYHKKNIGLKNTNPEANKLSQRKRKKNNLKTKLQKLRSKINTTKKWKLKGSLTMLPSKSKMITLLPARSRVQLLSIMSCPSSLNSHLDLSHFTLVSDPSFMSFWNHCSKTIINRRGSNNFLTQKSIQWKWNLNRKWNVCERNLGDSTTNSDSLPSSSVSAS